MTHLSLKPFVIYIGSEQLTEEVLDPPPTPATSVWDVCSRLAHRLRLPPTLFDRCRLVLAERVNLRERRRCTLRLEAATVSRPLLLFGQDYPIVYCPSADMRLLSVEEEVRGRRLRCWSQLAWVFAPLPTSICAHIIMDRPETDVADPGWEVTVGDEPFPSQPPRLSSKRKSLGLFAFPSINSDARASSTVGMPLESSLPSRLRVTHVESLGRLFGSLYVAAHGEGLFREVWVALIPEGLFYWPFVGGRVEATEGQCLVFDDAVACYSVSDTDFELFCRDTPHHFRAPTPADCQRWVSGINFRKAMLCEKDLMEMADAQMSVLACANASRDRRLYLWLGKFDEALHTAVIRDRLLQYADRLRCGEMMRFWSHACVYERTHPIPFTAPSTAAIRIRPGDSDTVAVSPEFLGPDGRLIFPSEHARAIARAHARYLYKRFVAPSAPQQISCPDKVIKKVQARLDEAPPDLFLELRCVVCADVYVSLFAKFSEFGEFSALRRVSPQLLQGWRDVLAPTRLDPPAVCVPGSPPRILSHLCRPGGRVAAHVIASGLPTLFVEPGSRVGSPAKHLTSLHSPLSLDRGLLRAIITAARLSHGFGYGLLKPSETLDSGGVWGSLWRTDEWPDISGAKSLSFGVGEECVDVYPGNLGGPSTVTRGDLWRLQDAVAEAVFVSQELNELDVEDFLLQVAPFGLPRTDEGGGVAVQGSHAVTPDHLHAQGVGLASDEDLERLERDLESVVSTGVSSLRWRRAQLLECEGSQETGWFLRSSMLTSGSDAITTTLYHILRSEGRGHSVVGPALSVVSILPLPLSSPSSSVSSSSAISRTAQGWVYVRWREFGNAFRLSRTSSLSLGDAVSSLEFQGIRDRYDGRHGWPSTRAWAVLYSNGTLCLASTPAAGVEGGPGEGFWGRLHLPSALEVCPVKSSDDAAHGTDVVTHRGVLTVVPEDPRSASVWSPLLAGVGPHPLPPNTVLYQGCLYKRGRIHRGWKLRFCTLVVDEHALIRYYDVNDDGTPAKLRGTVDLRTVLTIEPLSTGDAGFGFSVLCQGRLWQFLASNAEDVVVWMLYIRRFMQSRSEAVQRQLANLVKSAT